MRPGQSHILQVSPDLSSLLYPFATEYEKGFQASQFTELQRLYWWLPLVTVSLYLYLVVYKGPRYMQGKKLPPKGEIGVKYFLILWNGVLSIFSILGFLRVFPFFAYTFLTSLLKVKRPESVPEEAWSGAYLFCTPGMNGYGSGPVGAWVIWFMWSKYAELLDTVLLVIRKKPVSFLHFFHHATVLMYCWYAGAVEQSTGIFFAVMNYGVHALMYTYYCAQAVYGVGWVTRPPTWAKLVTSVQLMQMGLGVVVTAVHIWLSSSRSHCETNNAVLAAAAAMYSVYGGLFVQFFLSKYNKSKLV